MLKSNGQSGTEILLEAMSKDKVHLARFVLDALDGEILDSQTEGARTPLISSVLLPEGRTRCKFVELLLQRGARVNGQDGSGRTALSYACERGYLDAVKVLVRHNADPEVQDAWGNTALMYAAVSGRSSVVEFLVRAFKRLGLQIDRQNKAGNSAVEVARFLGHTECISALTHNSKREQPRHTSGNEFERGVGHLEDKLQLLQTSTLVQNCTWQPRPRMKQDRVPSMNSIEEFQGENDDSSSPQQDLVFSGVLNPTPPLQSPNSKHPNDHLPPLKSSCEYPKSTFFSPRPSRNTSKPCAPSALGILLTPILSHRSENELGREKSNGLELGGFQDSYYKKRCSLPSSMFSPSPPERTLAPVRKSRTVRRRGASPSNAEPPQFTAGSSAATTFSVLSNKLLRRFTSPEFKRDPKELEQDPELISLRIPRSETFPQAIKHPQVDSKPSIDSISSVKCEFDFHFRKPNF